jgi:PAS domain S-box-containing protein
MSDERVLARLKRAFWTGALALVAIGLTFALFSWLEHRNLELVLESQATGRIAREARGLSLDRETSIRGYLLTRQTLSLAPEFAARAALKFKLDSLVLLSQGNVSQSDRAMAVRNAVRRWDRGWAEPVLAAVAAGRTVELDDPSGKELFDGIRSAFTSFLAGEQRIFSQRVRILAFLQRFSWVAIFAEITVLLAVLWWMSRRSVAQASAMMHRREVLESQSLELQQQAAELEEQAVELEEQTDEANRNANELLTLNQNLRDTLSRLGAAESSADAAHARHAEAQSLLDFVLNNSPVGVALFDRAGRHVRVNEAMARMTGLALDAHAGKKIEDVLTEDLADMVNPMLDRVLSAGEPVINVPVAGASRNDPMRERHFLFSLFPVAVPGGASAAGAVVLETTQYRQLEEQLLQAQKMEAVGRLAGGIAHDFNNMLTAIKSYSELLATDMAPESQQRADINEVMKAADKATALTRQLLAFSRQQVLRPATVDLNSTVDGLRKILRRLVPENIELTCRLAPGLWTVTADPTELERVILNLVLNSRDAMQEGGKLIIETSNVDIDEDYAATHADTAPGPYVMVAVTDTGEGMSREVREKLFEPFFTTKGKGKGTGLGLSSVYGIVKQSGGFIWVYSEPGRGTTFKVFLPQAEETHTSTVTTPRRNKPVGPETILLVEDDDEVRQVATRILRNNGYHVLEATNGAEALRMCEAQPEPVDLIVTDLVMPGMGGSELAAKVRETQPNARILFTSGYTEDAVVRRSFMNPGEAFIEKPFTPASLSKKAREMLAPSGRNGGE